TVPYGSTLTISEADYPSYTTTVSGSGAVISERTATLPASATVSNREVTFTNTQTSVSPTGYGGDDHMGAFQGLCLLGLALLAAVVIPTERKRRKAAADGRRQM
ncbi:MAG: hypothetical protein IIY40_04175, partial [Firmicutes bacterium]|nr:hypothetical protein [Bacillota bacterium]